MQYNTNGLKAQAEAYWASKSTALVMHTDEGSEMGTTHCYGAEHPRGGFLCTRDTTPVVRHIHGSLLVHSASFAFNRTLLPT
jgi:hypothetical protein